MPNIKNIKKEITKCKHPNSRKTIALTKQIHKEKARKKTKLGQYVKQNLIAEKVMWFRDNLSSDVSVYSVSQTDELIKKYLSRFDDELEQISIKHSIGGRKNRQHASREDIINLTKKREFEEYNTCGLEIPDILNDINLEVIRKWNGELRFLQNIKMRRISKKYVESTMSKNNSSINKNKQNNAPLSTNKNQKNVLQINEIETSTNKMEID